MSYIAVVKNYFGNDKGSRTIPIVEIKTIVLPMKTLDALGNMINSQQPDLIQAQIILTQANHQILNRVVM